jgi:MFS family permease
LAGRHLLHIIRPVPPALPDFNPFRALHRHPNFRLFWSGQTLSLIGTWMQQVAQGWLALELTNNAFRVGLVSAAGSFPVLLLSLWAGVLVDRMNKLKLVIVAQALLLVAAALLWYLAWTGGITYGWLLALSTVSGIVSSLDIPARQSLMVDLVAREDLLDAIALNSSGFNMARIVGPAIAAVVIARLGLAWCFGVNALSYVFVIAALMRIRLPARAPVRSGVPALHSLREGLGFIRSSRDVSVLMRLVAVHSVFGLPFLALMPVIARNVLHTGASGYGLLLSFVGIGAVIGALALAALGPRIRHGKLLSVAAPVFGATVVLVSLARSMPLAAGLLLAAGLAMIVTSALCNTLLQTLSPDALRGRVMSVYTFAYVGLFPIGAFTSGAVAQAFGAEWAVGVGAAIVFVYATWTFWRHPEIRRL